MKRKFFYSFIVLMLALPSLSKAQSADTTVIYKEWALVGESKTFLDVSYRIIKCTNVNQVHLFIFNENPADQTANFEVEITNTSDGQKFTKDISFAAKKASMNKAECNSDSSLDSLKLDLPSAYDPTKITVKITFKP